MKKKSNKTPDDLMFPESVEHRYKMTAGDLEKLVQEKRLKPYSLPHVIGPMFSEAEIEKLLNEVQSTPNDTVKQSTESTNAVEWAPALADEGLNLAATAQIAPTSESAPSGVPSWMTLPPGAELRKIAVKNIRVEKDNPSRQDINEDVEADYTGKILDGKMLPPIVVFEIPNTGVYYLGDGWTRTRAAIKAGKTEIEAYVIPGGAEEAIDFALASNSEHGARLTSADKRKKIRITLERHPNWSAPLIADACNVVESTVRNYMDEQGIVRDSVVGKDGKAQPARKQKTAAASEKAAQKKQDKLVQVITDKINDLQESSLKAVKAVIDDRLKQFTTGQE